MTASASAPPEAPLARAPGTTPPSTASWSNEALLVPSPTPTRPDVARLRNRLNMLVLILPGQFLSLVAMYWLRFVPAFRPFAFDVPAPAPWVLLTCAAVTVLPRFLPRSYFRPRPFERGGLYPALGVRAFRAIATDGDWINRRLRRLDPGYRLVRDRRTLAE